MEKKKNQFTREKTISPTFVKEGNYPPSLSTLQKLGATSSTYTFQLCCLCPRDLSFLFFFYWFFFSLLFYSHANGPLRVVEKPGFLVESLQFLDIGLWFFSDVVSFGKDCCWVCRFYFLDRSFTSLFKWYG